MDSSQRASLLSFRATLSAFGDLAVGRAFTNCLSVPKLTQQQQEMRLEQKEMILEQKLKQMKQQPPAR